MFKKILIANRGEIAVRIIRACREMGIKTVAVYSDADRNSLHVRYADEAYRLGPPSPAESYLDYHKIVDIAKKSKSEAIHPGYGFLAENFKFAKLCEKSKIVFIGPPAKAIENMGIKTLARKTMESAGVPIIPGTSSNIKDEKELEKIAKKIGFPLMLKASAGGGGKGMRLVREKKELKSALRATRSEAKSAFGDDSVYIEKFVENPRHIEVQILADKKGNTIHLNERECSIQRRHQKVIEESPSPIVSHEMRKKMGEAAIKAAQAVGYYSAGTVEFLVDKDKNFYFLEMNTRLQVEHPVTEMITGIDIVKEMIRIAAGLPLSISQEDVTVNGHSIECRIYAEDPEKNFMPSPGKIMNLRAPGGPGIRDDSGVFEGFEVSLYYDPLISKLVSWGRDRKEAIEKMRRALDEYYISGIKTTIPFHKQVMKSKHFIKGDFNTSFIDTSFEKEKRESIEKENFFDIALISAALSAYMNDMKNGKNNITAIPQTRQYNPWKGR
ncbi:MAG: acetyl-CoA carboxylase biotin carboxylase subunit [Candidatus Schekmanbacteria bacterium]|nr:MAG: acetyl-CoA carboxylase biotin carboxylase subunit [Candidatus Schekmanbacteria bacterium]